MLLKELLPGDSRRDDWFDDVLANEYKVYFEDPDTQSKFKSWVDSNIKMKILLKTNPTLVKKLFLKQQ